MREVVLDTETTGLDPNEGHRVVEIGAVELINHIPTKNQYHQYINPQRSMPTEAFNVHGLSEAFLSKHPAFEDIADDFLGFIGTSPLIIHNAPFDMKFLNAELTWSGRENIPLAQAIDSLELARSKFPGAQNSLDALCRRFQIDNSARTKHGALLDSEILAEAYLELIGGRQPDLVFSEVPVIGKISSGDAPSSAQGKERVRQVALPERLTDDEKAAHAAFVEELGQDALWKKYL